MRLVWIVTLMSSLTGDTHPAANEYCGGGSSSAGAAYVFSPGSF